MACFIDKLKLLRKSLEFEPAGKGFLLQGNDGSLDGQFLRATASHSISEFAHIFSFTLLPLWAHSSEEDKWILISRYSIWFCGKKNSVKLPCPLDLLWDFHKQLAESEEGPLIL